MTVLLSKSDEQSASASSQTWSSYLGPIAIAALAVAATVFFWEGLEALFAAWRTPEYSHGPLIPVLSTLLFLRQLKEHPPEPGRMENRWPGVAVIAAALLFGALGKIARIPDIVAYALIVFVAGVVLVSLGWRRGRHFWPAVLHLAFMLPLPSTLYWKVSTSLQLISSELGVALIRLAGIPVFLEGNIIDLGVYKLHVAEACSGLRYLYPILSFSYIFAVLYRGPIWHKAVLLVSAAPITVVMNSVRIGIIGLIVDRFGLDHVESITHLLEGWVIFLTSVLILFGMARAMLALQRSDMTLSEALDLDLSGLGAQLARIRLVPASPALTVSVAMAFAAVATWHAAPDRPAPSLQRTGLALFPAVVSDWRNVETQILEPRIARALGADDYFSASFVSDGETAPVDLFIAWYEDQTNGGIHSPEVCLPGGGWEMAEIRRIDFSAGRDGTAAFPINRAIIQKGETRLLVYFWFEQAGGRTASDYFAKAALIRDSILHGRTDGALVRVITPLREGEAVSVAERRLRSFVDPMIELLPTFVPRL